MDATTRSPVPMPCRTTPPLPLVAQGLQHPWILSALGLAVVALCLGGFMARYHLRTPDWTTHIAVLWALSVIGSSGMFGFWEAMLVLLLATVASFTTNPQNGAYWLPFFVMGLVLNICNTIQVRSLGRGRRR